MSRQFATQARFNLPRQSYRRDPCRRRDAYHFATASHAIPCRQAPALPVRWARGRDTGGINLEASPSQYDAPWHKASLLRSSPSPFS